ncbi:hypothetical protein L596_013739 [Steinernema carpocapsae]|nr:hypothetical protein L596_013739 [Steinernema carpocapsae]
MAYRRRMPNMCNVLHIWGAPPRHVSHVSKYGTYLVDVLHRHINAAAFDWSSHPFGLAFDRRKSFEF